ncbi:MAG: hypothetical protein SNF33_05840 [Candidatus Algichlamydia australiensis]|nr:hypothetical protein [Chlamydiales bacterium]
MSKEKIVPSFSIVILANASDSHLLKRTLDSVLSQKGQQFEILLIDSLVDPVGKELSHYFPSIDCHYTTVSNNIFLRMNKGITLAKGEYIHFLLPGEFYNSELVFETLKGEITEQSSPDCIVSGLLMREFGKKVPHIHFPQISSMEEAQRHESLLPFFFKKELFAKIGKLSPHYLYQGNFDFLCRLAEKKDLTITQFHRIVTDYELRKFSPKAAIQEAMERLQVIYKHFGFGRAMIWWVAQNHIQFFKWWWRSVKEALGKS